MRRLLKKRLGKRKMKKKRRRMKNKKMMMRRVMTYTGIMMTLIESMMTTIIKGIVMMRIRLRRIMGILMKEEKMS